MNIGLDIDDTMTNTSELKIEYFKKHFNVDDMNKLMDMLNPSKIDGELSDFFEKNLLEMTKSYTLKDNVKEVIDRLRSKGHKIFIITARGCRIDGGIVEETKKYLDKNGIAYDKIILKLRDKTSTCIENNIDIMVDDSINILEDLRNNNIKVILYDSIINEKIDTDIDRVNNWIELENYINCL
jgi:acid phosphatase class B